MKMPIDFKLILYIITIPITVLAMDSVNINAIFKKNKVFQARLFYFFIIIVISYIFVNFIYDFYAVVENIIK